MYFDGTLNELTQTKEYVTGVAVDASGNIYLSTAGNFTVTGLTGGREDIFVYNPASGAYDSQRWFDGSHHGLSGINVMGFDLP